MTDAPEKIWAQDAEPSECNYTGGGWWDDECGNTQYSHMVEYIRADLVEAVRQQVRDEMALWHVVENAPEPGTSAIVWWDGVIFTATWFAGKWMSQGQEVHPTHWKPLPEPPEVIRKGGCDE